MTTYLLTTTHSVVVEADTDDEARDAADQIIGGADPAFFGRTASSMTIEMVTPGGMRWIEHHRPAHEEGLS